MSEVGSSTGKATVYVPIRRALVATPETSNITEKDTKGDNKIIDMNIDNKVRLALYDLLRSPYLLSLRENQGNLRSIWLSLESISGITLTVLILKLIR